MKKTLLVLLLSLAGTGCSSLSNTQRGTLIGAGAGGAVGAVVGNAAGSTAKGAIIGAAVGGGCGRDHRESDERPGRDAGE